MTRRALTIPRPIGWPLLQVPNADGQLRYPTMEESVRQMIEVILRTRPGEQLMRPDFGAGLDRFLHEPNTPDTRRRISELVATSLARWEQRIVLDRIEVGDVPDLPSHVRVEIAYRLKRTGAPQKVGLTMELGG